jgi:nicotinate-nucleotide adenylyltransferase
MTSRLRVFFGGTFDPPHLGHHEMLTALLEDAWVEAVHLVPTGRNPLKVTDGLGTREDRLRWLHEWIDGIRDPKLVLETIEIDGEMPPPQYTVDTQARLAGRYPGSEWALCIGGDIVADLHKWKNIETLLKSLHSVWVFPRGVDVDNPLRPLSASLRPFCEFRLMGSSVRDVSSTGLRALLTGSDPVAGLQEAPLLPRIRDSLRELVTRAKSS